MSYKNSPYFHIGRATELKGTDRVLYRFLEMVPGILSWGTILGTIVLSYFAPVAAAIFIIAFDLYWLLKTIYLSYFLRRNWKRMKHNLALDWTERMSTVKHEHIWHLVILPFYSEGIETIEKGILSLIESNSDTKKMIVVLAAEGKRGPEAQLIAKEIEGRYGESFGHFLTTIHPADVEGEMAGKGANISYASKQVRVEVIDAYHIPYEDILVSAFDIDTVIWSGYFACLTWHFLTAENPFKVSFQPVPLYNNNIWDAPALSRVVARCPVTCSIDTTRAGVASEALKNGATLVNDISAGRDDPDLLPLVARTGAPVVLMHMQGTPLTMQRAPTYDDVVTDVCRFLVERRTVAVGCGIEPMRILFDPGIGFGKTIDQNLQLLARQSELLGLGAPLLIGTSRKGFIGSITGETDPARRTYGTAATIALAVANGAGIVRVHDVRPMKQVVDMVHAIVLARRA